MHLKVKFEFERKLTCFCSVRMTGRLVFRLLCFEISALRKCELSWGLRHQRERGSFTAFSRSPRTRGQGCPLSLCIEWTIALAIRARSPPFLHCSSAKCQLPGTSSWSHTEIKLAHFAELNRPGAIRILSRAFRSYQMEHTSAGTRGRSPLSI